MLAGRRPWKGSEGPRARRFGRPEQLMLPSVCVDAVGLAVGLGPPNPGQNHRKRSQGCWEPYPVILIKEQCPREGQ